MEEEDKNDDDGSETTGTRKRRDGVLRMGKCTLPASQTLRSLSRVVKEGKVTEFAFFALRVGLGL